MKRYLCGVPFRKVATITNRIASVYDGIPPEAPHRRRSARQQALPDRSEARGFDPAVPYIWRHVSSGILHKRGKDGSLGCGGNLTEKHIKIPHFAASEQSEQRCSKVGCWPKPTRMTPKTRTAAMAPRPKAKPMVAAISLSAKQRRMVGLRM